MTAALHAWFNGQLIASSLESEAAALSAAEQVPTELLLDRSSSFGDGVFETLFIYDGRAHLLDRHLRRLSIGLDRLGLKCPMALIQADINKSLSAITTADSYILKLVVSRGSSHFGYGGQGLSANRLVLLEPYVAKEKSSYKIMVCDTRLGCQPILSGIKHCNRLEQVLAKKEVEQAGFDEGIVLDQSSYIVEATAANVFILEKGRLLTSPIVDCGVAGVMREYIMGRSDFSVDEERISLERLYQSDGCVLSNAVQGLTIVSECKKPTGEILSWEENDILTALHKTVKSSMYGE